LFNHIVFAKNVLTQSISWRGIAVDKEKKLFDNIKLACANTNDAARGLTWRRVELGNHLLKMKAYLKEQPKPVTFTAWLQKNQNSFGLKSAALHLAMKLAKQAGGCHAPIYTMVLKKHGVIKKK